VVSSGFNNRFKHPAKTIIKRYQSNGKIAEKSKIYWIVVEMFRRGGICLLGYQFRPFLRFFYWIVVEMFRRGGICLLGYQFTFPPQSNRKSVEKVKIDTLTNKYHPVWTFPPQSIYDFSIGLCWDCSDGVVFVCYGINFDLFYDFSIGLWWKCSDGVVFVC
jgi:hypothetical protein